MDNKKKRISNFTHDEKDLLTNLVLKHQGVIENKRTDAATNSQKLQGWISLSEEFNNSSSSCYRTPNSLKSCWENIKRQKKKESACRKKEIFMTGGGKPPASPSNKANIVEAILGPALEGIENIYDSDAVQINDKENESPASSNYIVLDETEVKDINEVVYIPGSSNNVTQEKVIVYPELFCRIEHNIDLTWQAWTPSSLKQPVTSALLTEPTKTNWLKRRRPQSESLSDQLLKEKIKLVQTLIENAKEEAIKKQLILDEQLKQEKIKTEKLLNEN